MHETLRANHNVAYYAGIIQTADWIISPLVDMRYTPVRRVTAISKIFSLRFVYLLMTVLRRGIGNFLAKTLHHHRSGVCVTPPCGTIPYSHAPNGTNLSERGDAGS
ncbi:hypothetical protein D2E26_0046 [Bifidobacterium dolichotidis]|uniref:Uncharacterized protein n=1 Tax=Bifidobacterium dolichotidis TaxID=2306976 RepID=A0A430FRK7_9BIFI|nr:hypothetical protein D2E26_0046 [Bifidobacterium dolichotidis]